MPPQGEDWLGIVERIVRNDGAAFVRMARLITGFLSQARAFDFQADWDDVVQDVITGTIKAVENGQIRHSGALVAYARTATRNKVIDRIRRFQRRDAREVVQDDEHPLVWCVETLGEAEALDVRDAVERLPEKQRIAVLCVYAEGKTYEEAARDSGVPLGSLKRYLRQGLTRLQEVLEP